MPEEDSDPEASKSKEEADPKNNKTEDEPTEKPETEQESSGSPGTVQLSVRSLVIGVFVLGIAIGFSGGVLTSGNSANLLGTISGDGSQDSPQPSNNQGNQQETQNVDMSDVEIEGEPVLGDSDAAVTMFVYEDFQCPFCKRFEEGAFQQIKSNYVDTGQVKVVWKDRPLPQVGHEWAEPAAAAMECVYREGGNQAFWNVKEKVFANQNTLSTSNIQSQIKTWASEEGVSESSVQSCLDNGNPMEEVNQDSRQGQNIGAGGTPTAFVDGEKIVGAQPYSNFEQKIENALS